MLQTAQWEGQSEKEQWSRLLKLVESKQVSKYKEIDEKPFGRVGCKYEASMKELMKKPFGRVGCKYEASIKELMKKPFGRVGCK